MYETILFPTDGSDHSTTVAEHAIETAATIGATLRVLSVVDDRAFLLLADDRIEAVRGDLRERAREAVDAAATRARARGVETETAIVTGDPAERILADADEAGADLIAMGTSGDEYERNVVGSVSRRVVADASVPVLTIGPDA